MCRVLLRHTVDFLCPVKRDNARIVESFVALEIEGWVRPTCKFLCVGQSAEELSDTRPPSYSFPHASNWWPEHLSQMALARMVAVLASRLHSPADHAVAAHLRADIILPVGITAC